MLKLVSVDNKDGKNIANTPKLFKDYCQMVEEQAGHYKGKPWITISENDSYDGVHVCGLICDYTFFNTIE